MLAAGNGLTNKEIASKLALIRSAWRKRFAAQRMDGLHDEPRPGAPRGIGDDEIATRSGRH